SRFRHLVESSPIGIFEADSRGSITYVNPYILSLTGHPESAHLETRWVDIVHEDDRERVVADWTAAVAGKKRLEEEFRLRRADGEVISILVEANPEFGAAGRLTGFIGSVRDVTAERRAEAGLKASELLRRQIFEAEPE